MQVGVGDRVTIHGLKARPELNGQSAVLVGQAAGGRITVRLDSGEQIALKQENLGIQAPGHGGGGGGGMSGGRGGMPGAGGGMPGFGGGMPGFGGGGMPSMPPGGFPAMAAQAAAAFQQQLAAAGIHLPPGVSVGQAAIGAIVAVFILSRFLSPIVLVLVGLAAYWGTQVDSGRAMLARGSAKASAVLGRPLPPWTGLCALCLVIALLGHTFLSSKSVTSSMGSQGASAAAGQDASFAHEIREAYNQGYEDGAAGVDRRPPKHIPTPSLGNDNRRSNHGSSSGFSYGSLMKYGMVGYTVYNLGKTPGGWNPQVAMVNAKANPLQVVMMLVLVSGFLF